MKSPKYIVLKGLFRFTARLSLGMAQRIGAFIGSLAWHLPMQARRVTMINLGICLPDLSPTERSKLARQSLRHTGRTIMEIPLMWEWPVQRCLGLIREVEGEELIRQARQNGTGLILLAPHIGNWELAGLYFSSRYKMAALYSPPNMADFETYMIKVRSRLGSELVRGDRRGLARLAAILRDGGVAGILPDQSPRGNGNTFAPFFGMNVKTMTLAVRLMQKTGAQALLTYAQRLDDGNGFRIVIRRTDPDMTNRDPAIAVAAMNHSIERCVLEIPAQYQWEYKRMRHRPAGEIDPYNPDRLC